MNLTASNYVLNEQVKELEAKVKEFEVKFKELEAKIELSNSAPATPEKAV
jgi:predicted nuclease with TOPRIM domain